MHLNLGHSLFSSVCFPELRQEYYREVTVRIHHIEKPVL